ncbi:hypothetical protein HPB47_016781 [Ixodes persulcatus]|uniref:Uncharacterized protein n=1 Tax=Ixodes persulcatus TaxID=34615 RepID=A0AC60QQ03_IXOPE|nr:hypothetical protein HPB47_016781 [Ixodes persulcatus]
MAGTFSKCRLFCPDYARRHKSKIEYQRNFRKVSDLDFELLKQLLPAEQAASVNGDDSICKNCFAMFKRDLQDFVKEQRRLSLGDAAVEEEQAMIEDVKEVISAANPRPAEFLFVLLSVGIQHSVRLREQLVLTRKVPNSNSATLRFDEEKSYVSNSRSHNLSPGQIKKAES